MRGSGTGTLLRKGLEAGEMKRNYQTALNISQTKEDKGRKKEIGGGGGGGEPANNRGFCV